MPLLRDFPGAGAGGRRIGENLSGQVDGATSSFTTPTNFLAGSIAVYYNGQRLLLGSGNDYTESESGGSGTGFDTIDLTFTPKAAPGNPDKLVVDYTEA